MWPAIAMAGASLLMGMNSEANANAAKAASAARSKVLANYNAASLMEQAALQNTQLQQAHLQQSLAIESAQADAEAQAMVNAAASGVEGGAVDMVKYQTRANEAYAQAAADEQLDDQMASVGESMNRDLRQIWSGVPQYQEQGGALASAALGAAAGYGMSLFGGSSPKTGLSLGGTQGGSNFNTTTGQYSLFG